MACMVVTLEVSQLRGWLKADANCREGRKQGSRGAGRADWAARLVRSVSSVQGREGCNCRDQGPDIVGEARGEQRT